MSTANRRGTLQFLLRLRAAIDCQARRRAATAELAERLLKVHYDYMDFIKSPSLLIRQDLSGISRNWRCVLAASSLHSRLAANEAVADRRRSVF